jgi:hypothetical protein
MSHFISVCHEVRLGLQSPLSRGESPGVTIRGARLCDTHCCACVCVRVCACVRVRVCVCACAPDSPSPLLYPFGAATLPRTVSSRATLYRSPSWWV